VLLKDAKITAIFTTEYKRTRDTAQPLAAATGVVATAIDSKDAATLIGKLKASSGNVLVVGHSNTVPDIIKALGVGEPVAISDDQFDNLFVVIRGAKPALLRLHYR
jgi:phosphohistidine phosphatase SixA